MPSNLDWAECRRPPTSRTIGRMSDQLEEEDWYLQEWMAHFGKRQSDMTAALGWTPNRTHFVFHSTQAYRRPEVNAIAAWLGIKPYELLMPPQEALRLRSIRQSALEIAAQEESPPFVREKAPPSARKAPTKRRSKDT